MNVRDNITAAQVRAMLDYNEKTGEFHWKPRTPDMFSSFNPEGHCKTWNARYAGKKAGSPNQKGYLLICIYGVDFLAHRLAFFLSFGRWPGENIDHINGDASDNRLCNIREASQEENCQNMKKPRSNTSGYVGVSWCRQQKQWAARIHFKRKFYHLGRFDSKEEAYQAYLKGKAALHKFQPIPREHDEKAA